MLRYAFLKSDFHPQLLILGDRKDFSELASLLREFAKSPRPILIPKAPSSAPETNASLTICLADDPIGLRMPDDQTSFQWKINAEWAGFFSERVEKVAQTDDAAMSEILEIGGDLDEIPIKISRGEFTEEFLDLVS